MTDDEARLIVARLIEAYPVPAWTDGAAGLWVEMLRDLDRDATARVVRDMIASRPARPAIADIRVAIATSSSTTDLLASDEAWGHVQRAIGSVGRYRPFPREHPLVAEVVESIGWQTICDTEAIEVTRAQFRQAYTQRLERARVQAAVSPGAGSAPQLTHRHESDPQIPQQMRELVAQVMEAKR